MMKKWILVFTIFLLANSSALARECRSCQEHLNGGSISYGYAPGGIYQPGGTYYPGGVYPGYGSYYGDGGYNSRYGSGTITQTCGPDGNCVSRYRGPASDIQYLPKINRHLRQSQPSSFNNPWNRPEAVPLR